MERLFSFIYSYRVFLLFVALEFCAFQLIRNKTIYQQHKINQIGHEISGEISSIAGDFNEYLYLKKNNEILKQENAKLRDLLEKNQNLVSQNANFDRPPEILNQYYFIPAKVVNNTTRRVNNFLTINKGLATGIKPGMGVVSSNGVIGKVDQVSSNFSTVISILNTSFYVSAKIKNKNIQCTLKWDAKSSHLSKLLYVPRHLNILPGDTIVTSGFNSVFPENMPLGKIEEVQLSEDASFYNIVVKLFTEFKALQYVYVVGNRLQEEQENLESSLKIEDDE